MLSRSLDCPFLIVHSVFSNIYLRRIMGMCVLCQLYQYYPIIGKFDILLLMCGADRVWITELTSIHKNIIQRSVHNSHVQVYQSIWCKTHYDVTDKNDNVSSEGLEKQYHKYPNSSIGLADILAIMSVSAFKIAVTLYLSKFWHFSFDLIDWYCQYQ